MSDNHFAYPWFEKCHLTHLRYVSVTLSNPPRSLPLQKHLLTPKQNITRIKTPKTQTLFERERPEVRSDCSSWFGAFGGRESTCFASSKLGKVCVTTAFVFLMSIFYRDPPTLLGFAVHLHVYFYFL